MPKSMLIDANHSEETRVVVLNGSHIEEFDFEVASRRQLRGNIYLAKVTRVEPSLQAAFVEYGGNRQGFLAFNEIHPDYYQIPVADREALLAELADQARVNTVDDDSDSSDSDGDDLPEAEMRVRQHLIRRYKIQEVIKRRQIMLVQVVKEERGNKGAALTSYLSLAGRYCVLMPNTARGGGISRKITNVTDRKRLKSMANALEVPQGMGLIIRTAGAKRTRQEIRRDYDYLLRVWENIRSTTLSSNAPALIYEEEDLVKRAIRDMFDKDFDAVLVEGDDGFKAAKDFIRILMPSQAKKVHHYRSTPPLFSRYGVDSLLENIYTPTVPLKSGGYLVINQTEALVAIDVNSGKSTKERNIESTALKTNLEAAEEAARQMRLRDLAGLVVIDFIDMEEPKNNRSVEKRLKDALALDRARVQMGKISTFGLMEISRQRRRTGVLEGTTTICPHCEGLGRIRSVESAALAVLRALDHEVMDKGAGAITVTLPPQIALYILNEKQAHLTAYREEWGLKVSFEIDERLSWLESRLERTIHAHEVDFVAPIRPEPPVIEALVDSDEDNVNDDEADEDEVDASDDDSADGGADQASESQQDRHKRRRRRRTGRGPREDVNETEESVESDDDAQGQSRQGLEDSKDRNRRRRGRRGGRNVRGGFDRGTQPGFYWVRARTPSLEAPYVWIDPFQQDTNQPRELGQDDRSRHNSKSKPHAETMLKSEGGSLEGPVSLAQPVENNNGPVPLIATTVSEPSRRRPRPTAKSRKSEPATEATDSETSVPNLAVAETQTNEIKPEDAPDTLKKPARGRKPKVIAKTPIPASEPIAVAASINAPTLPPVPKPEVPKPEALQLVDDNELSAPLLIPNVGGGVVNSVA